MGSEQPIEFSTALPPMVDLDALREQFPCSTCMGVGFLGFFSAMQGKGCPTCEGSGIELPAASDLTANDDDEPCYPRSLRPE